MNIEIRKPQINEIPQLVELCALHAEYEKYDFIKEGKVEKLSAFLFSDNPPLQCYIALAEGEMVAYTTFSKQFSTWQAMHYLHMDCLFVLENHRGKVIGEMLVNKAKEAAKEMNCTQIQWQTPHDNVRAIKFYHRIGGKAKQKLRYCLNIQ